MTLNVTQIKSKNQNTAIIGDVKENQTKDLQTENLTIFDDVKVEKNQTELKQRITELENLIKEKENEIAQKSVSKEEIDKKKIARNIFMGTALLIGGSYVVSVFFCKHLPGTRLLRLLKPNLSEKAMEKAFVNLGLYGALGTALTTLAGGLLSARKGDEADALIKQNESVNDLKKEVTILKQELERSQKMLAEA